jgi:hypothetical protein
MHGLGAWVGGGGLSETWLIFGGRGGPWFGYPYPYELNGPRLGCDGRKGGPTKHAGPGGLGYTRSEGGGMKRGSGGGFLLRWRR